MSNGNREDRIRSKAELFWDRLTNQGLVGNKKGKAQRDAGRALEQFAMKYADPVKGKFIAGNAKGSPEDPTLLVIVIQTEAEMDGNAY